MNRDLQELRVGLVGCGRMGSVHADSVRAAGASLISVHDTDSAAAEEVARAHDARVSATATETIEAPVDAVVIASATESHADLVRAAAEAGVAVFVEKPGALNDEELDVSVAAVRRANVPFQIGFQRRWDRRYQELQRRIANGAIGRPLLVRSYGTDPSTSPRSNWGRDRNGGIFLNCAIHDFDYARFLLGEDAISVSATRHVIAEHDLLGHGDGDMCVSTVRFESGAVAVCEWNRFSTTGFRAGVEVHGSDGALTLGPRPERSLSGDGSKDVRDHFAGAFRSSIRAFLESVAGQRSGSPGVNDAEAALKIALAARRSSDVAGQTTPVR